MWGATRREIASEQGLQRIDIGGGPAGDVGSLVAAEAREDGGVEDCGRQDPGWSCITKPSSTDIRAISVSIWARKSSACDGVASPARTAA